MNLQLIFVQLSCIMGAVCYVIYSEHIQNITRNIKSTTYKVNKQIITEIPIQIHIDPSMSSYFKKRSINAKRILKQVLNQAERIFQSSTLQQNIKLKLLSQNFTVKNKYAVEMVSHGSTYLKSYCNYEKKIKTQSKSSYFSIMITASDLYYDVNGIKNWQATGRTYSNGICNIAKSCAIVRWRSVDTAYLVVHELAHSMGINHDGSPFNKCNSTGYIMNRVYTARQHPRFWSKCSRRSMKKKLITKLSTSSIEELFLEYEDDKNAMLATSDRDDNEFYEELYEELDNNIVDEHSLDTIYFGPPNDFLRIDADTLLHILHMTVKEKIPVTRALLAWDMITDGKTCAFLQSRELMAFDTLLNVVPEEDLYKVNFGDISVLRYFASNAHKLKKRKTGVLVSSYRRYYGNSWLTNNTQINELGYLICGFPVTELKQIPPTIFKDISVTLFNKLKVCSAEQTQVLYNIAIKDEAYGKPGGWTAHTVSKLGYLFSCIPEDDISSLSLQAMNGITKSLMKKLDQNKLILFTRKHVLRMNRDARRIYILRTQLKFSLDTNKIYHSSCSLECRISSVIIFITLLLRVFN